MKDQLKSNMLVGSIAVLALGVGAAGCSGGSTGKGGPLPPPAATNNNPVTESETTEVLKTSTSVGTTAVLPLQVALSEVSPGNFPTSQATSGSLNTTVTGDSASGNIVFDFTGSGLTGQITANYAANGSAGSVAVSFNDFGVQTSTDTFTMNGTLNVNYSYSGSSATGVVSGTVTITINAVTVTVAMNLTVDYDGVQDRFVIGGTTSVTHSQHGAWSTTFAGVIFDGATAEITNGTITLTQSAPAATAVYVFSNGQSSGTFTIAPAGISGSFQL